MTSFTAVPFRTELHSLATIERKNTGRLISFFKPFTYNWLAAELLPLASQVGRTLIRDADAALQIFFEKDAAELLRRAPSLYWLWLLVANATAEGRSDQVVSLAEVHAVVRKLRDKYNLLYDFSVPTSQIRDGQGHGGCL